MEHNYIDLYSTLPITCPKHYFLYDETLTDWDAFRRSTSSFQTFLTEKRRKLLVVSDTGLGLWITRRLIELHNVEMIWIESLKHVGVRLKWNWISKRCFSKKRWRVWSCKTLRFFWLKIKFQTKIERSRCWKTWKAKRDDGKWATCIQQVHVEEINSMQCYGGLHENEWNQKLKRTRELEKKN